MARFGRCPCKGLCTALHAPARGNTPLHACTDAKYHIPAILQLYKEPHATVLRPAIATELLYKNARATISLALYTVGEAR